VLTYVKEVFGLMSGNGKINSISCLDYPISYYCFENFRPNLQNLAKAFFTRCFEVGEIIPIPDEIIKFPVFETNFETFFRPNMQTFAIEVFRSDV
jgi:hypothetical protein